MNFKKGMTLHFQSSGKIEAITKGSSDMVMGMIKTDQEEYSCDFIRRWLQFGFVKLYDKKGIEITKPF